MSPVVKPPTKTVSISYITLFLLGDPKLGKTRLAAEMPDAYFLDFDRGAGHTGCWRNEFQRVGSEWDAANAEVARLARLKPGPDGALMHQLATPDGEVHKFPVRTVVVDSLTEAQEILRIKQGGKPTGNTQRWWGNLLDEMRGFVNSVLAINAHLVFIAHPKVITTEMGQGNNTVTWDDYKIGLDGSIRDRLTAKMDAILYLTQDLREGKDKAMVLTQPTKIGQNLYTLPGDRYHIFGGKNLPLFINGDINREIITRAVAITTGGLRNEPPKKKDAMTGEEFETYIEAQGWSMEEAKTLLKEKFGGFQPEKAGEYITHLEGFYGKESD